MKNITNPESFVALESISLANVKFTYSATCAVIYNQQQKYTILKHIIKNIEKIKLVINIKRVGKMLKCLT